MSASLQLWFQFSFEDQGAGMGLAPSGRDLAFNGLTWLRVKEDRITEGWDIWNLGGHLPPLWLAWSTPLL